MEHISKAALPTASRCTWCGSVVRHGGERESATIPKNPVDFFIAPVTADSTVTVVVWRPVTVVFLPCDSRLWVATLVLWNL
jgi:hypothetical protein